MALTQFVTYLLDDLASPVTYRSNEPNYGHAYVSDGDIQLSSSDDFLNMSILDEIKRYSADTAAPLYNALTTRLIYRYAEFSVLYSDDEASDPFCYFLDDLAGQDADIVKPAYYKLEKSAYRPSSAVPSSFLQNFTRVEQISSICSPRITSFLSSSYYQVDFKELESRYQNSFKLRAQLQRQSIYRLCYVANPALETTEAAAVPVTLKPPSPSVQNVSLEPPVMRQKMLYMEPRQTRPNFGVCIRQFYYYSNKTFQTVFPEITGGFADVLATTENHRLYHFACSVYLDKSITDCRCARFTDLCKQALGGKAFAVWMYYRVPAYQTNSETLASLIITIGKDFRRDTLYLYHTTERTIVRPFSCTYREDLKKKLYNETKSVPQHGQGTEMRVVQKERQQQSAVKQTKTGTLDNNYVTKSDPQPKRKSKEIGAVHAKDAFKPIYAQISVSNEQKPKRAVSAPLGGTSAQQHKITQILTKYNEKHPGRPPLLFKEVYKLLIDAKIIPDTVNIKPRQEPPSVTVDSTSQLLSPKAALCKIDANAHAIHSQRPNIVDSRVLTKLNLERTATRSPSAAASSITQYSQSKIASKNVILLRDAHKFTRRIAGDELYNFEATRKVHFSYRVDGVSYTKARCEMRVWENNYLDDPDQIDG